MARCPKSWPVYWPEQPYSAGDRRAILASQLEHFFLSPQGTPRRENVHPLQIPTPFTPTSSPSLNHAHAHTSGTPFLERAYLDGDVYVLPVDYTQILAAATGTDLQVAMSLQSTEALSCVAAAAYDALFTGPREPNGRDPRAFLGEGCEKEARVEVRLYNHPDVFTSIRSIKSSESDESESHIHDPHQSISIHLPPPSPL